MSADDRYKLMVLARDARRGALLAAVVKAEARAFQRVCTTCRGTSDACAACAVALGDPAEARDA